MMAETNFKKLLEEFASQIERQIRNALYVPGVLKVSLAKVLGLTQAMHMVAASETETQEPEKGEKGDSHE